MSTFARVCLIGFGEVGQILADDLIAVGVGHLTAFDILFSTKGSIPSKAIAERTGVRAAPNAPEAALGCDLILSAVTAASDLDAALSVVRGLSAGAFYVDLNSVSPRAKRQACAVIEAAGGRYVEAAVMSPFPPKRIGSPMLLGGPHAQEFRERSLRLGFKGEVFSDEIGPASATKMCRSVLIKGLEALLTESMLAARLYGVEDTVLTSLSDLLPVGDWEKLARYMISRSLEHGTRRAEEMREVAQTVRDAGVQPLMSSATAKRQDWAAEYKSALSEPGLGEMLDRILDGAEPHRAVGGR
jgi:3-hydroxyisobutyrate dehydrogenase-like beta-hydroxyacid dehydrogenase